MAICGVGAVSRDINCYGKHLGRARQKLIDMDRPSNSAQPTNAEVKDPGHPSRNSSSLALIM